MIKEIAIAFGLLVVLSLLIAGIIYFSFWLKTKKILKDAPKFTGEVKDIKEINFDPDTLERRRIQNGERKEKDRGSGEGTERPGDGEREALESKIRDLKERIRSKEGSKK